MNELLDPVTPGELLSEEFLKPMGLSQYRLAKEIGVPAQRIGDLLHGERVRRRAGPDPDHVDAAFYRCQDMLARSDLRGCVHPRFAFYALQPGYAVDAYALEPARFGAWFPQSGAE